MAMSRAVRSACILSKRQIPDMVSGARRAGARVLRRNWQAARSPESGSGNEGSPSGTRFEGVADFGSSSEPPQKPISPFTDAGHLEFNPDEPIGAQAQRYVVRKGRETGNEYVVAIDANGHVVAHGHGAPGRRSTPGPGPNTTPSISARA